jgi:hypothetical protein
MNMNTLPTSTERTKMKLWGIGMNKTVRWVLSLKGLERMRSSSFEGTPNFPVACERQEKRMHGVMLSKTSHITKGR